MLDNSELEMFCVLTLTQHSIILEVNGYFFLTIKAIWNFGWFKVSWSSDILKHWWIIRSWMKPFNKSTLRRMKWYDGLS